MDGAPDQEGQPWSCLLYTSDAADERSSVDLGGRRIIKKKKNKNIEEWDWLYVNETRTDEWRVKKDATQN